MRAAQTKEMKLQTPPRPPWPGPWPGPWTHLSGCWRQGPPPSSRPRPRPWPRPRPRPRRWCPADPGSTRCVSSWPINALVWNVLLLSIMIIICKRKLSMKIWCNCFWNGFKNFEKRHFHKTCNNVDIRYKISRVNKLDRQPLLAPRYISSALSLLSLPICWIRPSRQHYQGNERRCPLAAPAPHIVRWQRRK